MRDKGAPGITAELVSWMWVAFYVDRGFLCFKKEFSSSAEAEAVIGRLGCAADLYGVFVYDLFVSLSITLFICYVPAQFFEKGVDEFSAKLGLVILL